MPGAIQNPNRSSRKRLRARGAIVRRDRGRLCAAISGECRTKRSCVSGGCTRSGIIGEDPIGFADGPNLYRYAGNDPVNLRDPSGLSASHPLYGQGLGVLQPQFQQSALANLSRGGSNTFSSPSSTGAFFPSGSSSSSATGSGSVSRSLSQFNIGATVNRGPVRSCIVCHNPIISGGGSISDLPQHFQTGALEFLGADSLGEADATLGRLRTAGSITRNVGVSAAAIASAPISFPLTGGIYLSGQGNSLFDFG